MDNLRYPNLYPQKNYLSFIQLCHSLLGEKDLNPNDFEIRSLEICDSTNDVASELLDVYKHTIVLSMIQEKGKGRKGDVWESPIGGIWLSIGLKTSSVISELSTPIIQIVYDILSKYVDCEIKEPNDILINGKKVCGLLVESTSVSNRFEQVIIGIGINVFNEIPENLEEIATKIKNYCDPPSIPDLASELCTDLLSKLVNQDIISI